MTCNSDCNQGRNCDCSRRADKDVVIAVLFIVLICGMTFVVWEFFSPDTGSQCAVEVQFKDSKATYIGISL